jgi:hypothetical protein
MVKRKVNEDSAALLQKQMAQLKREKSELWLENEDLKKTINTYRDIVVALIDEPSFWSEKAIKTGLISRLKKLIK